MRSVQLMQSLFVVTGLFALPYASSFEENDKFCIRTEPLLLADIENQFGLPLGEPNCDLLAMTMTIKEKMMPQKVVINASFTSLLEKLVERRGTAHNIYKHYVMRTNNAIVMKFLKADMLAIRISVSSVEAENTRGRRVGYRFFKVHAVDMSRSSILESFLNTMCKDHGKKHTDDYSFFQLRNGEIAGRESYHDICSGKKNPLLAWIPYSMIQRNFAQELDPKERTTYIAKATDVDREKTELCHFRHTDLVTNISSSLFSCIVMIFEDNFYGLESNINVLVEIKPIMYELRNVTYLPWSNVTKSYKTVIGKSGLKNPSRDIKQIYGSIDYAYVEKVKLNTSLVYDNNLEKLPLLFEHKNAVLELDDQGIGGIAVKEKAYFGRSMDPKSSVKLDVIGQWAEHRQQFSADIYEYFGFGIKRFKHELHNGVAAFILIESTEPVYDSPESSLLTNPTLHTTASPKPVGDKLGRLVKESTSNETDADEWNDLPTGKSPYPGFYPWFIVALLIFGAVILISVYGMVRSYSKRNETEKYKFSGI